MRTRWAILLAAVVTAVGIGVFWWTTVREPGVGIAASGDTRRPNVLLISVDTLRADHLSSYGYDRATSPNVDRLAKDGVVFEDAMSVTSWTLPSHLSILSSLYPQVHGVMEGKMRFPEEATLCTELLKPAGYVNSAVVSAPYLNQQFGYDAGFDIYEDFAGDDKGSVARIRRAIGDQVPAPRVNRRALEILEARPAAPFFLFLHYFGPHFDYSPPPPFDSMFDPTYEKDLNGRRGYDSHDRVPEDMDPRDKRHLMALYDGEVAWVDSYVGKLWHYLRAHHLYDDMLIIFTADHGEEFWEHGKHGHRKALYTESVHVPLIIKFPGNQWRGRRIKQPVGSVDIVPTILAAAGIESLPIFDGRSLVPVVQAPGTGSGTEMPYYFELDDRAEGVRRGGWKLLRPKSGPKHAKLFNLRDDPGERHNLAESTPAVRAELEALLDRWREEAAEKSARIGPALRFDYGGEMQQSLEDLGYVEN